MIELCRGPEQADRPSLKAAIAPVKGTRLLQARPDPDCGSMPARMTDL
jgi:hypothetical protein